MIGIKYILKITFLLCLLAEISIYSSLGSRLPGLRLRFEDLPNGLSHNTVNCFAQDSQGFIWVGTQDGLNRFDVHNYTIYKHDPQLPNSISSSTIQSIYEDKLGNMWIGTYRGGLNLYRIKTNDFIQFDYVIEENILLSNSVIYDIVETEAGILWIGTSNGLIRFDVNNYTFLPSPVDKYSRKPKGHIGNILNDSRNFLWIGTDGQGLWRYDLDLQQKSGHIVKRILNN